LPAQEKPPLFLTVVIITIIIFIFLPMAGLEFLDDGSIISLKPNKKD